MQDVNLDQVAADSALGHRNNVLSKLFSEHHGRLFHFVLSRVRSADDSADLVDQAFAEACKAFGTFRGESEMRTWLYGIAMNLVRNHVSRSPRWRYEFSGEDVLEELPDGAKDVARSVENKQVMQRVQWHLSQLPANLRQTLLMVSLDELSYEETASRLGIPVGTVRSRVSRSRALLRERLMEESIDLGFGMATRQ